MCTCPTTIERLKKTSAADLSTRNWPARNMPWFQAEKLASIWVNWRPVSRTRLNNPLRRPFCLYAHSLLKPCAKNSAPIEGRRDDCRAGPTAARRLVSGLLNFARQKQVVLTANQGFPIWWSAPCAAWWRPPASRSWSNIKILPLQPIWMQTRSGKSSRIS